MEMSMNCVDQENKAYWKLLRMAGMIDGLKRFLPSVVQPGPVIRYLPWSDVVRRPFASGTGVYRCGRKNQPGIGHQAVVVESDADAVGLVVW